MQHPQPHPDDWSIGAENPNFAALLLTAASLVDSLDSQLKFRGHLLPIAAT
jgi:hypothetical protein